MFTEKSMLMAAHARRCKMARFDERSGQLYVTELGRVASHFYIRHSSIVAFNEMLRPHMSEAEVRIALSSLWSQQSPAQNALCIKAWAQFACQRRSGTR